MAKEIVEVFRDGELVDSYEVDVPDEVDTRTPEEIAMEEINAVSTVGAKVNALIRYIERKKDQT